MLCAGTFILTGKNGGVFYSRRYQELWHFLFPTSDLFVILNICSFILIESLGSESGAKQLLLVSNRDLSSCHACDFRAPVRHQAFCDLEEASGYFMVCFCLGASSGSAQSSVLDLCSGFTPVEFWGPYGVPGVEPRSAAAKQVPY